MAKQTKTVEFITKGRPITCEDIERVSCENMKDLLEQIEEYKKEGWVIEQIQSHSLHIAPLSNRNRLRRHRYNSLILSDGSVVDIDRKNNRVYIEFMDGSIESRDCSKRWLEKRVVSSYQFATVKSRMIKRNTTLSDSKSKMHAFINKPDYEIDASGK